MSGLNKSVELQLQVRHQSEELRDFMRELDGWEKDIKKKDEDLRRQGGAAPAPEQVRGGGEPRELGGDEDHPLGGWRVMGGDISILGWVGRMIPVGDEDRSLSQPLLGLEVPEKGRGC